MEWVCRLLVYYSMRIDQLETDRLRFRPMRMDDVENFQIFYSDPKLARFIVKEVDDPIKCAERFVKNNIRENHFGQGQYAIELKDTGELIGSAGFVVILVDGEIEMELCGRLLPEYHNKSFGLEAGIALRNWASKEDGFKNHICLVHLKNHPAQRLCEKLGFIRDREIECEGINVAVFKTTTNN